MSSHDMSKKSKSLFALESNHHFDGNLVNTSWSEWKDSDLNNEKWGSPKNGPDGLFLDVESVAMPRSLEPDQWIRAKDLHLTSPLVVYTMFVDYPDLITNNKHLLHSEFIRWFISALTHLQYCGREGLEISGEDSNFVWAGRRSPWYGWTHVYSLNKAGEGVQHRPLINPNGKYVVRLHCMGCWRRLLVDDTIPVDKDGRPLLPRTSNNYELWPMLLAKALLKVASLTWTEQREIVDFHPIACLTGWICLTLNVAHLSLRDKWDFLARYSEHFEWTPRTAARVPESSDGIATDETGGPGETLRLLAEAEKPRPITLFLLLGDTRQLGNDAVPGLSPCWDHVIHVVQSRDVPLDPKDVKLPLARWKMHRWLKWAISQKVIDPADYFVPIRYLRVISPLGEREISVVHVRDESDAARNLILPSEIERSDKSAWGTRSQRMSDSPIVTKEEAAEDVGRWIDFNKMAPYVTEAHLFYKLEYFRCSIRITGDLSRTTSENRKSATGKEKADTYDNTSKILKSGDKPLYLFCDSLEKKFFLINLCSAPREKNVDSRERDYLILERYNWFFGPDRSDQSITISTIGTKSTVVELAAGRQLLQVYRHSKASLAIVSSDTDFYLADRATVQQLMTAESNRIERISRIISDSVREAYQSFGTNDYPAMLRKYYRSYVPDLQRAPLTQNKKFRMLIHDSFMEEQIRLIGQIVPDEEIEGIFRSLKIFFLNPNIRSKYFDLTTTRRTVQDLATEETSRWSTRSRSYTHKDAPNYNKAATIIQSFLKMALVKTYKELHNSDHARHIQVREKLLKIADLFDSSVASRLLRNVISRRSCLRDLYPCSDDFAHVLNIQEFKGVLANVKHERWIPIVRLVVNPKFGETVFAAFELLVDLPRFALRVFDNRNGREMTRVVNQVAPVHYVYHPAGYTVFAYGWSEKQRFKELHWSIRTITMKGEPMLHQLGEQRPLSSETKPPKLTVEESVGTYVPNVGNCISRWILRATSGSIISVRLTTSYELAEIRMKVADERGNVLADVNGGFTILLPLVILKYLDGNEDNRKAKNKSQKFNEEVKNTVEEKKLYYMEAFVLNDSWPLTDIEWAVVNQMKMKTESIETKIQSGNETLSRSNLSVKKDSKQFVNDNQALEPPYWILQVVTDARDAVEICEDKRKEQEIALLKKSWWSEDPGRPERGKKLREAFLGLYASEIESETSSDQNERQSKVIEDEDMAFCLSHARQRRTLRLPESHLHLPALNLTKYVRKDEIVGPYRIKTKNDDDILRDQHTINIIDSQRDYSSYLENLAEVTSKQLRKNAKFFREKEESFRQRRAQVDAAYESRRSYIDSLVSGRAKAKEKGRNRK